MNLDEKLMEFKRLSIIIKDLCLKEPETYKLQHNTIRQEGLKHVFRIYFSDKYNTWAFECQSGIEYVSYKKGFEIRETLMNEKKINEILYDMHLIIAGFGVDTSYSVQKRKEFKFLK